MEQQDKCYEITVMKPSNSVRGEKHYHVKSVKFNPLVVKFKEQKDETDNSVLCASMMKN